MLPCILYTKSKYEFLSFTSILTVSITFIAESPEIFVMTMTEDVNFYGWAQKNLKNWMEMSLSVFKVRKQKSESYIKLFRTHVLYLDVPFKYKTKVINQGS